ncbi:MAG TPA: hypothetical protein VK031_09840 [Tissierellaceae bacterium]|nr:hypothetical protein [Tissierellaceae bacterium]
MAFYNDQVIIIPVGQEEIYIFKLIKEEIIMDYYNIKEGNRQEVLVTDALKEFDAMVDEGRIYLIYQNKAYYLKMLIIDSKNVEEISLSEVKLPRLYELKLKKIDKHHNILYMVRDGEREDYFHIHHYLLVDEKWESYQVAEVRVAKVLNPLICLNNQDKLSLAYYHGNKIHLQEFNLEEKRWMEAIGLTDEGEKLYLDLLEDGNLLHLAYAQYEDNNFSIKYKKFTRDSIGYHLEEEKLLSNEGNASHPTLLIQAGVLWLVWKESLNLLSRYSLDQGQSWSPLYLWKDSKALDYYRYKYVSERDIKDTKFKYSFGTLYPDVKLLGFGALENVEEIPVKKKNRGYIIPRF